MARNRAAAEGERSLLVRVLNPHGFGPRRLFLQFLFCVALALLIVDRLAHYLFWPAPDATEIVLIGSERCPHSRAVKARLEQDGLPYRLVDARRDGLAAGLAGWAFQSVRVPIVVVGPEIIHGNRRGRIDAALARRAERLAAVTSAP